MAATIHTDVLVVGAGAAGLRAALEARLSGARVLLAVKGCFGAVGLRGAGASANGLCQGGGVLYGHKEDVFPPPDQSYAHTIQLGLGLADPDLVRLLIEDSTRNLTELASLNIHLNRGFGRGVRAHGVPLVGGLAGQARSRGVQIRERLTITRLLVRDGACSGAVGVDETNGEAVVILARAVILATGGDAQLFRHNLNPPCVTGDGYAMGYQAGAELMNIEFKQVFVAIIHPTRNTIYLWAWDQPPKFLNARGQEFLAAYCPPGVTPEQVLEQHSLHDPASTRDPYSRFLEVAIMGEVTAGRGTPHGGAWLDYRGSEHLLDPNMAAWYHYRGIFSDEEMIEVTVCHHCSNGGFRVDENAQTTVPGLYAVGECLTGPHGADRRGGHMLAATQVFGARAGRHAGNSARQGAPPGADAEQLQATLHEIDTLKGSQGQQVPGELKGILQQRNWQDLLWGRSEAGLNRVLAAVEDTREAFSSSLCVDSPRDLVEALELGNMLTVTEMIARVALMRQETRGSHYRLDFPERNDGNWLKCITVKQVDGRMHLDTLALDPGWQDRAAEVAGFRWG